MRDTERLTFIEEKTQAQLDELWRNCFEGVENQRHMNEFVPFPLNSRNNLGFLNIRIKQKSWLIKRINEGDIIGFAIHGDFIPGQPNNIGFNIGLNYTRKGYATESLNELINYCRKQGLYETFGHCFENNTGSVIVMLNCGFENLGYTGEIINNNYSNNNHELKFKKNL